MKNLLAVTMLAVTAMLLAASGGEARFYIDIPGAETNYIPANTPLTIEGKMDNNTGENVIGISNGIRIYSPDGAVWQTPTTTIGSSVATYFDFQASVNEFSVNGTSDDTIGIIAVATGAGVPNGLTGLELFSIETQINSSEVGRTICIDSTWFPPSNTWLWVTPTGTVIPDWEGPYCWNIVMPDTCYADGDANGNGTPFELADAVELSNVLINCASLTAPLYHVDLNGDCLVDSLDLILIVEFITTQDTSIFDPYGGYPVPTCCDPALARPPQTVEIFGLEHTSYGSSCLDTVNGELIIFDNGDPGEAGVEIDLGEVTGVVFESYFDTPPQDGDIIHYDIIGQIDGIPNQPLTTVDEVAVVDETAVIPDFVFCGSPSFTVAVVNEGLYVDGASGLTGEAFRYKWIDAGTMTPRADAAAVRTSGEAAARARKAAHDAATRDALIKAAKAGGITWAGRESGGGPGTTGAKMEATIAAHSPVVADLVIIYPDDSTYQYDFISDIQISLTETPMAAIPYEGIAMFNSVYCALGSATFEASDGMLTIDNIGSSGDDGVSIEAGETDYLSIRTGDINSHEMPVGSYLQHSFSGTVNDTPGQSLGVLSVEFHPDSIGFSANFAPIGADSIFATYYCSAGPTTAEWIMGADITLCFEGQLYYGAGAAMLLDMLGGSIDWFDLIWKTGERSNPDTVFYEVHFYPAISGHTIQSIDGATVQAALLDSFSIINVTTAPPSCCNGDGIRGNVDYILPDEINIADLTYLVAYLFTGGAEPSCIDESDIDGNDEINIADLTYLVAYLFTGGPPPVACP
ncbi:MAG: hypothetical protein KOO62_00835 [candidate division Zixibacteria bacterium]|nr:hypothetical protein [candidate division Zixibacteria bacterium]